jgi:peptide subunit release factor 1 (eRF1)
VDEHLARNFKTIAEQLVKWVEEKGAKRVLLSGTEADLSVFEQQLPQRVGQLVCARLRIDPNANMGAVQEEVEKVLSLAREAEDAQAIDALFEKGVGTGRAASGSDSVAQAVTAGKVHTLYLDKSFREPGWTCSPCNLVGAKIPAACPSCGKPVDAAEVGEELVRRTLATDGTVSVVRDHPGLLSRGGVAAMVRYG